MVLNKVGIAFNGNATANAAIGLATGYSASGTGSISGGSTSTGGTTVTRGAVPGQPAGQGVVYASANVIPGSTVSHVLGSVFSTLTVPGAIYDLEGSVVIPPGGFICLYASAAQSGASIYASYQWEEVPV